MRATPLHIEALWNQIPDTYNSRILNSPTHGHLGVGVHEEQRERLTLSQMMQMKIYRFSLRIIIVAFKLTIFQLESMCDVRLNISSRIIVMCSLAIVAVINNELRPWDFVVHREQLFFIICEGISKNPSMPVC